VDGIVVLVDDTVVVDVDVVCDVVVVPDVDEVEVRVVVDGLLTLVDVPSGTHATILKSYMGLGLMKVMTILLPDTVGRTTIGDEVNDPLKTTFPPSSTIFTSTVEKSF
jgi:hypothetical protein